MRIGLRQRHRAFDLRISETTAVFLVGSRPLPICQIPDPSTNACQKVCPLGRSGDICWQRPCKFSKPGNVTGHRREHFVCSDLSLEATLAASGTIRNTQISGRRLHGLRLGLQIAARPNYGSASVQPARSGFANHPPYRCSYPCAVPHDPPSSMSASGVSGE